MDQKRTQLPYQRVARGGELRSYRKILKSWEDGDELRFRIDTDEDTVVFEKYNKSKYVVVAGQEQGST